MVMLQKNILATFCSSDELVVVTASCIVSKFLQQNLQFYGVHYRNFSESPLHSLANWRNHPSHWPYTRLKTDLGSLPND